MVFYVLSGFSYPLLLLWLGFQGPLFTNGVGFGYQIERIHASRPRVDQCPYREHQFAKASGQVFPDANFPARDLTLLPNPPSVLLSWESIYPNQIYPAISGTSALIAITWVIEEGQGLMQLVGDAQGPFGGASKFNAAFQTGDGVLRLMN